MIRPIFTELVLFLMPFALYALFLIATRARVLDPKSWPVSTLATLAIVSLLLVVTSFLFLAHLTGAPPGSTYEPARIEDGRFIPGGAR